MPYVITDKCIECASCEPFCKNKAISRDDGKYVIDRNKCEMCGTCSQYCPIDGAIAREA
jgi:MinD superfamily P-loop ATPase